MATTWNDKYAEKLRRLYATQSLMSPESVDISALIKSADTYEFEASEDLSKNPSLLWGGTKKVGKTILDQLMRGTYTQASASKQMLKDIRSGKTRTPLDIIRSQMVGGSAWNRGASVMFDPTIDEEDRVTFADALKVAFPSENRGAQIARGTAGFALDVGTDPLTYLPGGVILKLLSRGGPKAIKAGASVADDIAGGTPQLAELAADVAPKVEDVTAPVPKSIEPGATPPVQTIEDVQNAMRDLPVGASIKPADVPSLYENVADTVPIEGNVFNKFLYSTLIESNPGHKLPNGKMVLDYQHRPDLSAEFRQMVDEEINLIQQGKRPSPGLRSTSIHTGVDESWDQAFPLFREITGDKADPTSFGILAQIAASNPNATLDVGGTAVRISDVLGTPAGRAAIKRGKATLPDMPTTPLYQQAGVGNIEELQSFIDKSPNDLLFNAAEAAKMYVRSGNTNFVSLNDFAKTVSKALNSKNPVREVTRSVKTANTAEWEKTVARILTPDTVQALKNTSTAEQFMNVLKSAKGLKSSGNFETVEAIRAAYKAGLIDRDDLIGMYRKLNLNTSKTIEENLAEIESVLKQSFTKLSDETPPVGTTSAKTSPEVVDEILDVPLPKSTPEPIPSVQRLNLDNISPEDAAVVSRALTKAIDENVVKPIGWQYRTKTGTRKTGEKLWKGNARNYEGWNIHPQMKVAISIMRDALAKYPYRKFPQARDKLVYKDFMRNLRYAEEELRQLGVTHIIGQGKTGYPFSAHDMYKALGEDFVTKFRIRTMSRIDDKNWFKAVEAVLDYKVNRFSKEEMERLVGEAVRVGNNSGINNKSHRLYKPLPAKAIAINIQGMQDEAIAGFIAAQDELFNTLAANAKMRNLDLGQAAQSMSAEVLQGLIKAFSDVTIPTNDAAKALDEAAKLAPKGGDEWVNSAVENTVVTELARAIDPEDIEQASNIVRAVRATENSTSTTPTQTRVQNDIHQANSREAADMIGVDLKDLDPALAVNNGFLRAMFGLKSKFNPATGHKDLHAEVVKSRNAVSWASQGYTRVLGNIHKKAVKINGSDAAAKKALEDTWTLVAQGIARPVDPRLAATYDLMKYSMDTVFSGLAQRNGMHYEHLNRYLALFNVPEKYRFEKSLDDWKKWEVKDPLDTLSKVYAGLQTATTEKVVATEFVRLAQTNGLMSMTPKAGFVKISSQRSSVMLDMLPKKAYFEEEIARQFASVERFIRDTTGPSGNKLLREYIDPVLSAYKTGLTIYRPGHHVRNMYGDVMLSFLAGVQNPTVYGKALRVMRQVRPGMYDDFDAIRAVTDLPYGMKEAANSKVTFRGKQLDSRDLWTGATKQGIFPSYSTLEDIGYGLAEGQKRLIGPINKPRPFGGQVHNFVSEVSQSRDHYARLAHFIDVVQKSKAKTLDEAFEEAGKVVRKWHPDGSDLTSFERKYMRRIFTFYSWMARALPLTIEAAMIRPGKTLIYPKAMYNLAESMGIDLSSVTNPFPTDQLFPEFVTDELTGPAFQADGNYYAVDPGNPQTDIGNDLGGAHPHRTLLNSLSPWLKIPLELSTSQNMGLGTPITNKTEYAVNQLPFINYGVNIATETNPTGEGGNQAGFDELAMVNFLTGMGLRNLSKPNYGPIAETDLTARLKELSE